VRFTIGPEHFELDGRPHRVLSGALHYFRVHPDQWADRIAKARLMGLNTIETYVPWNAHEPTPGEFVFDGGLDLGRFLDVVAEHEMHAIVRPGPYICAEWSNGGLPPWLFTDGRVGVRRNEPLYLAAVRRYLGALAPSLVPRQIDAGGPIVLVQIENEYGAYGSDPEYLRALVAMNREIGLTVPFTTVDQPIGSMLEDGSLPELHKTGSFGSRANERLARLRAAQPVGPLMCSEFWDGWFDSWGEHHHITSAADSAQELDDLLAAGASVNIYMFHGGTNFGLTNGANDKGTYRPIATSYDYDAPLDEAGIPTEKFFAFREVIAKYESVPSLPAALGTSGARVPAGAAHAPTTATVRVDRRLPLAAALPVVSSWSSHTRPPTLDALGTAAGFVLYRTEVDLTSAGVLTLQEVRDRAQVFVNGDAVGVLEREHHDTAIVLPAVGHAVLDLLVEDQGRVDYGPRIGEAKGIVGDVCLDQEPLRQWKVTPLDLVGSLVDGAPLLETLRGVTPIDARPVAGPTFALGRFLIEEDVTDLHLALHGFTKGVAWINGFCLGRYWSRGPQRTLFVPAPVLLPGRNEVVVFELHAASADAVTFQPSMDLGHTEF
jgi:beta-galactosidase